MADTSGPDSQLKGERRKLVIQLAELDEVYTRFRVILLLTTLLTLLLALYVGLRIGKPDAIKRVDLPGLCFLLVGAVLLCVAQYLCLRYTTHSGRKKIEALTFLDPLTEVYNYRYLNSRLGKELEVAKRFGAPLTVAYMDLDGFKRVNDEHGHQIGNEVLRDAAELLEVSVRSGDLFGRAGGDEFLLILPNTGRDEAQVVCERARERMEQHMFECDDNIRVDYLRVSVGVASYPVDARDREELVSRADQAMYRAKQAGGNRVSV